MASISAALRPSFSSAATPAMVVPPAEQTGVTQRSGMFAAFQHKGSSAVDALRGEGVGIFRRNAEFDGAFCHGLDDHVDKGWRGAADRTDGVHGVFADDGDLAKAFEEGKWTAVCCSALIFSEKQSPAMPWPICAGVFGMARAIATAVVVHKRSDGANAVRWRGWRQRSVQL